MFFIMVQSLHETVVRVKALGMESNNRHDMILFRLQQRSLSWRARWNWRVWKTKTSVEWNNRDRYAK